MNADPHNATEHAATTESQKEMARLGAALRMKKRLAPQFIAEEVARRMAQRLTLITVPVGSVHLQRWPGDTQSKALLSQRFPAATGLPVRAQGIRDRLRMWVRTQLSNDSDALIYARNHNAMAGVWPGCADLLWSNLVAAAWPKPLELAAKWHEALNHNGFVMFSSLGPDTAQELILALARQGDVVDAQNLVDMHDWGDALVHAGFVNPVVDMEKIVLTYQDAAVALQELLALLPTRPLRPGLVSRQKHEARLKALAANRNAQGQIEVTLEVIYGHAFKLQREGEGSAGTSLDALKATLPSRRKA